MPVGVVLLFDPDSERRVRDDWNILADAGVSRSMSAPGFRPHLSLTVGEDFDIDSLGRSLESISNGAQGFDVRMPSLGVFVDTGVVYLAVTPAAALLDLHRRVDSATAGLSGTIHAWYRPDDWMPHVTVAFDLEPEGLSRAVRLLADHPLKLTARAESLAIVEGDDSGWKEHGVFRLGG